MSAPDCLHQARELPEVLGEGLRRARETAVGLQVDGADPAAQRLQQRRDRGAAGAAHAVECHVKAPGADPREVDHRELEHQVEMPGDGARVLPDRPDAVPAGSGRAPLRERAHRGPRLPVEKDPVGAYLLEGVPFDRIVARGEHQARAGMVMLDRQLQRGRRHHPDVDHLHAHGHQAGRGGAGEHRAAGPGVASEDDPREAPRDGPRPECGGMARHQFRGEVLADDAPHAGNADHQGVGHRKSPAGGGRQA